MSADLYLASVLNHTSALYQPASHLAMQAFHLTQKDPMARLDVLAHRLFKAVGEWFSLTKTFDVPLYDLSIQVRDLCQGEISVWVRELSNQCLHEVEQLSNSLDTEWNKTSLFTFAQQIYDLIHERPEGAMRALIEEIVQAMDSPPALFSRVGIAQEATSRDEGMIIQKGLGKQSLLFLVRTIRNLASGTPLPTITEIANFLVGQEKMQHGLSLHFSAQVERLLDQLQQSIRGGTTDIQLQPFRMASLQQALAQWRAVERHCFHDLCTRLEEIHVVASSKTLDSHPGETQAIVDHLGALFARMLQEMTDWHSKILASGAEIVTILAETGIPQFPTSEDISADVMLAIHKRGLDERNPEEECECSTSFADLMECCVRKLLCSLAVTAGSFALFTDFLKEAQQLVDGQIAHILRMMTTALVKKVRPLDEAAEIKPLADGDVMDTFWYHLQHKVREVLDVLPKHSQEKEVDQPSQVAFPLAIQLRHLVYGNPSQRLAVLAGRLTALLGKITDTQGATDHMHLSISSTRQLCDLLQGN
ncbi:MAG: hypothetical protein ACRDF4_03210, partial [Rhabdochlamydiaceae bacterium]